MTDIPILIAFFAGLVSFLSPCVLPIVPGFLAYLAGSSLSNTEIKRHDIFLTSVFFVLGFSAVFATLGVLLNTLLEAVAYDVQLWLSRLGGAIIILFGMYLVGLLKLPFLEREYLPPTFRRLLRKLLQKSTPNSPNIINELDTQKVGGEFRVTHKFGSRFVTAFVFGAAFAAGWTPCVGAVLGGILGLAATAPSSAFTLLFSYSLGLGIPFLLVGLFASQASALINRYAHLLIYINIAFGIILILLGILAFTQNLGLVANLEILNRFLLK